MRLRLDRALLLALVLLTVACSGEEGAGVGPAAATSTAPPVATTPPGPDATDPGVLYVQHAVVAQVTRSGDIYLLTLEGAERRTQWVGGDDGGVIGTGDLVDQWTELGLDEQAPRAALVGTDPAQPAALLELAEPRWDGPGRVLVYQAVPIADADPRLEGLAPDPPQDPEGTFESVTLWIHTPETAIPTATTTTTTTTTSTTTTSTTTPAPTTPGPGPTSTTTAVRPLPPVTPAPTVPSTPVPTPPPTPPPSGEPNLVASTTVVRIPTTGGSASFVLRNIGSGVGSWSAIPPKDVGIAVAPSSGLIFPGSSTTVRVTYDGTGGPANDFQTSMRINTASGPIVIVIEVAGD